MMTQYSTKFQGKSIAVLKAKDSKGEYPVVKYNFVSDVYVCRACGREMTRNGNLLQCGGKCATIDATICDSWADGLRYSYWAKQVTTAIGAHLVAKYQTAKVEVSRRARRMMVWSAYAGLCIGILSYALIF